MKILMIKDQPVSNDGITVLRLKAGETYGVPSFLSKEIAKVILDNNLGTKVEAEVILDSEGNEEDEDTEIIDLDEDEEIVENEDPDVKVKRLTKKPIFSKYSKEQNRNKNRKR